MSRFLPVPVLRVPIQCCNADQTSRVLSPEPSTRIRLPRPLTATKALTAKPPEVTSLRTYDTYRMLPGSLITLGWRNSNVSELRKAGLFTNLTCSDVKPGRRLISSSDAGWTSILVETVESPSHAEGPTTRTSPQIICLYCCVKVRSQWRGTSGVPGKEAVDRPGIASVTAGLNGSRLRWSPLGAYNLETVRIYIPQIFFQEAAVV